MASRINWKEVKPAVVLQEGMHATLTIFTLAIGALKLPMLLGLWMLELVIVAALSASFYPQRGRRRSLMEIVKIALLCAILGIFLLGAYVAAGGKFRLESWSVLTAGALLALRLASNARSAKQSPHPKLAWATTALQRNAVVLIGLFIGAFACIFPGIHIALALRYVVPDVAADLALGLVLLTIQLVLVAVMSTMTEAELRSIAGNPYLD